MGIFSFNMRNRPTYNPEDITKSFIKKNCKYNDYYMRQMCSLLTKPYTDELYNELTHYSIGANNGASWSRKYNMDEKQVAKIVNRFIASEPKYYKQIDKFYMTIEDSYRKIMTLANNPKNINKLTGSDKANYINFINQIKGDATFIHEVMCIAHDGTITEQSTIFDNCKFI